MTNKRQHDDINNNNDNDYYLTIDKKIKPNDDNIIFNDLSIFESYTQMTQRMAFYAGIWNPKTKKFTISLDDAIEYGKKLPIAIELEYIRIENGNLPRKLTLKIVNELLINNNI